MTDMVKTRAKMMLIVILLAAASVPAAADDAMWTWVSGVNNYNPPSSTIAPGGREEGAFWIDSDRNLWFFGGYGIGRGSTSSGLLNGLWRLDGAEEFWELVKGYDDMTNISYQVGVYGTKGSPGSGNMPGARSNSVLWTGTSSYIYLFGGYGYDVNGTPGLLNDLWNFNLSSSSRNWTWVSGSNTVGQYGVYGTMGVAASGNTPGARGWSSTCADSNGTFWLFGGYGYGESGSAGTLNDLWKYSGSKWTWVSGSKSISRKGVYGTKGVANANNMPGTRYGSVLWMDTKGNLWLYGGKGYDSRGTNGYLCDSWKFDVNTNEWTWDSGSNLANQHSAGVYGTQGQSAADTVPGDREAFASWRDNYGYLWLFGGIGRDTSGTMGLLNDLWKFNGSVWEWVSGSETRSQAGIYGTKGTADLDNTPGARSYSVSCIDTNDNLWLFGGSGYDQYGSDGNLNDLWKFGSITPEGVQLRVFCEANEITSDQNAAFVLGTAPVRLAGPNKTFTIRNNGSKTLVFDANFVEPNHFILTQPQESTLAPGEYTTFTIMLDTNEIGVFEGTISFDNNDVDNNPFSFSIKGTVTRWEFGDIHGNTKNTKLTVPDVCGVSVTFSLTGGGYGEIVGDSNFSEVVLYDTGEKSLLTITTKTEISVGDINSDGPLKSITAKTTNLRGNINVSGSLASLIINDVDDSNDHTVTVGSSSNPKAAVSLTFDRVANLTINSQMPVKTISATEWLGGEIDAPSVGTITTKGNKKLSIAGDLDVNVMLDASAGSIKTAGTLSGEWNCNTIKSVSALNVISATLTLGQAPDAKVLALSALKVKSHITDSNIISGGNIGSISAGAMINSLCFAGIKDGVTGLPDPNVDINVPASIKSIAVKGIKGESNSFINSDIAAANILSATLNYPQENNGGIPFGVSAGFIKSVKIKDTTWSKALKSLDGPADNNDFDDLKIRLD
jgi:N-acetylneuraminic acid mutarotase